MSTEEQPDSVSSFDEVMADIRRGLVRRVASQVRDANRDIYDAREDE